MVSEPCQKFVGVTALNPNRLKYLNGFSVVIHKS